MKYLTSETNISKNIERRTQTYQYLKSKVASYSYPDIKHLRLTLKANLTEEKQPRAQHEYFT